MNNVNTVNQSQVCSHTRKINRVHTELGFTVFTGVHGTEADGALLDTLEEAEPQIIDQWGN